MAPRQCWAGSIEIGVKKREWGNEGDRLGWVGETGEWGGAGRRSEEEVGSFFVSSRIYLEEGSRLTLSSCVF